MAEVQQVIPLDPDSAKGREVAQRLNRVLAEIQANIWDREREAKRGAA